MGELVPIHYYSNTGTPDAYTYSETIVDGATSEPVLIHIHRDKKIIITIILIAGTGTGKFQYTVDPDAEIEMGIATWIDWDKGDVTGTVNDAIVAPISAVRAVSISGVVTFKIRI